MVNGNMIFFTEGETSVPMNELLEEHFSQNELIVSLLLFYENQLLRIESKFSCGFKKVIF